MDRVIDLTLILQEEFQQWAGGRWNLPAYPAIDLVNHIYAVLVVPNHPRKPSAVAVVGMARIVGDTVVIEQDISDRPLYERLMEQGIPREKIILTYAGESLPETMPDTP